MRVSTVIGLGLALLSLPAIALVAWLLWPVPEPSYDWKGRSEEALRQDQCGELGTILLIGAWGDYEGVDAYLQAGSIVERCPATLTDEERADLDDDEHRIRESISSSRRLDVVNLLGPGRFAALWTILDGRWSFRNGVGSVWHLADDVVLTYRCEWQVEMRNSSFWVGGPGLGELERHVQIPDAWRARAAWCADRASASANRLYDVIDRGEAKEQTDYIAHLAQTDRDRANRWREAAEFEFD